MYNGNIFNGFKVSWIPAIRQNESGRAAGGIICGLKKISRNAKNTSYHLMNDIISIRIRTKGI